MENLRILTKVLNKNKVKRIEVIDQTTFRHSKIMQLYEGILENKFDDDIDAASFLYEDDPNRQVKYNRVKRKLRERLINTLFFIDTSLPTYKDIQKAYYECYKNISAIKILLGRNAKQPAIELAERTLRKAINFEFIDIVLALARELRLHYGGIVGDKRKFRHYNKIVKEYTAIANAEIKVEEFFTELMVDILNSRASKQELSNISFQYASDLKSIISKYHSYRINLFAYQILALQYEIVNDFENTLKTCIDALKYFKKKEHLVSNTILIIYNVKILSCYLRLQDYKEAEKSVVECLQLTTPGTMNWFRVLDQKMILCFHTNELQKAFETYLLAINHPTFDQQPPDLSEHWRIYEAFIHYFISIDKIVVEENQSLPPFRLSRFLNQVTTFSKDKRGTNTSILILQFLFLLQQGKYGEIIERMEPLRTYNHRYLRKGDTFRSNCFIKMLLQLPAASFHQQGVIRKAKRYWEKLKSVPLEIANQSVEIEIVPYEMLWDFILESLDNKFHHSNRQWN